MSKFMDAYKNVKYGKRLKMEDVIKEYGVDRIPVYKITKSSRMWNEDLVIDYKIFITEGEYFYAPSLTRVTLDKVFEELEEDRIILEDVFIEIKEYTSANGNQYYNVNFME